MEEISQFNIPLFSEEQTPMIAKSTLRICVCCLLENVPFVQLSICKHVELFDFFFKVKLEYSESMVCYGCHKLLKDLYQFRQQVQSSVMWLNNQVLEKPNNIKLKELAQSHTELTYIENSKPIQNEKLEPSIVINIPSHEIKTEIKIEPDYSDSENDVPLSEIKQKEVKIKKDAPVKNYEGKVRSVFLSEEEMLEDRMKEAMKEGYLNLPYKCESCITGFDHELTLKEHMEKRHYETDSGFVCKVCKSVLSSAASYKEHTRRHYKRIECVECGVRYNTVQSVVTHYSKTHSQIDTAYQCRDCDYSTTDDSDTDMDTAPPEIKEAAQAIVNNLLPEKSKDKYLKVYTNFTTWMSENSTTSFSENVLLAYFGELSKTLKPSTLWGIYSMLKATLSSKNNVNINSYKRLTSLLKRFSMGYKSKKSKVLTAENVDTFLMEAPDLIYLAAKVVLIFGVNGACRAAELLNIKMGNIEYHNNMILINLPKTKSKIDRSFVIRDELLDVVKKYINLRPKGLECDRFFLNYMNGKCTKQPMGRHKIAAIPKAIAAFLNLPNAESYTGHCFRRTSATLLAESGANLTTLKRHGGWTSDTVAEDILRIL
ncbi:uncharacterized protein isoform X2 [Choristoneura fumiferana]|uniref:uncharacterized protein isoform X2 n=1 Tax=Choristoneura fumiferana TaxID=7141 RepID=UPI003D15C899